MKNKNRSAIRLLSTLFCTMMAYLPSLIAQSGAACNTAITIFSDAPIAYSGSMAQSQDLWFQFVALSSDARIVTTNTNKVVASINGLSCYFGGCAALYTFPGSILETTPQDSLVTIIAGLNAGETYRIKLSRTTACGACNTVSPAPFTLRVSTVVSTSVVCNCSTLFPSNTNNTCEAVCNGNFDLFNTGGNGLNTGGQIMRACPWQQPIISPSQTTPSPDLYNDAAVVAGYDVPTNSAGYQSSATPAPAVGFSGYAGIFCYTNNQAGKREYITQALNYTLSNNKRYRVSFKISLADNSGYAVKNIGSYLTNGQPTQNNNNTLNVPVSSLKAKTTSQTTNVTGWVTVTDTFTASGNLNYITIGQMTDDANASPIGVSPAINTNSQVNISAYYYIDSVSIVPDVPISVVVTPSTVCPGTTVNGFALDNGGVGNYTWTTTPTAPINCIGTSDCDSIQSIPPGVPNSIYFATTTLSSFGNCTATRSDTVIWKNGPTSAYAGNDQTICTGGTATLTGSSSGPYNISSWSVLNAGTLYPIDQVRLAC